MRSDRVWSLLLLSAVWAAAPASAQTGLLLSVDVPVQMGSFLDPSQAGNLHLVTFALGTASFPGFAPPAHVGGLEYDGEQARWLFSPESFVQLPGGVAAGPEDVVALTGAGYAVVFDGSANGVPAGAAIDAVGLQGNDLLLSFDVSVALPGDLTVGDEDIVRWGFGGFTMDFDGSSYGLADGLDVDGIYIYPDYTLVLSFDGSGQVGGVSFDDEDLLRWNGSWAKIADGTGWYDATGAADLEDFALLAAGLFADGVESGGVGRWSGSSR